LTFTALPFLADADSFSWSIPAGWEWITGDSTSSTALLLPPAQASIVTICVAAYGGVCSGDSVCLVTEISVGLSRYSDPGAWFTVHPNPSDGSMMLVVSGIPLEDVRFDVYDAIGHKVDASFTSVPGQGFHLLLSDATTGMYTLHLHTQEQMLMRKFIVQH